jgi:hypothetical protein
VRYRIICLRAEFSPPAKGECPKGEGVLIPNQNYLSEFLLFKKPHRRYAAPPLPGEEIPIAK